jgi:hypothetical protein
MLAQMILIFIGSLFVASGMVFSLSKHGYLRLVIRPSTVLAIAALLTACVWIAVH